MSEDLGIQKQQQSSAPYVGTGAAIGGLGACATTRYLTKPKYGSYEDIIKNMEPDKFTKTLENATGDDKELLNAAKEVRDAKATAEAEFKAEFEAFKKANPQVAKETDAYKELVNKKTEAEKALNEKIATLEAEEAAKLKNTPAEVKPVSAGQKNVINKIKQQIEKEEAKLQKAETKLNKQLEALAKERANIVDEIEAQRSRIQKTASKNEIISAKGVIKGLEVKLDKNKKSIEEAVEEAFPKNGNMTKAQTKEFETLVQSKKDEALQHVKDIVEERSNNASLARRNSVAQLAQNRKNAISTIKKYRDNILTKNSPMTNLSESSSETISNLAERLTNLQKNKLDNRKNLAEAYKAVVEEAKVSGKPVKEILDTKFSEADKKLYEQIVNGKTNPKEIQEALNKAIKEAEASFNEIQTAAANFKTSEAKIEELGGKGAKIENGILKNANGKKVIVEKPTVKLAAEKIEVPQSSTLASLKKQLAGIEGQSVSAANLTEEQIMERAKAAVKQNTAAYKAEAEAFNAAEAARKAAYDGLEKTAASEEELITKFLEKNGNGAKDQAEYISKKIETKSNSFIEKYGKQLESKLGKNAGWKIAGITAAGLVIGGVIGKLFAPKDNA